MKTVEQQLLEAQAALEVILVLATEMKNSIERDTRPIDRLRMDVDAIHRAARMAVGRR